MLSVIIPAHNEETRIGSTLEKLSVFLRGREHEIIIVDDGSDYTVNVASVFPNVRVVHYPKRMGKGYAMTAGLNEAKGDEVLIYDADAATPVGEIDKLLSRLDGNDVAIGSRYSKFSKAVITKRRLLSGRVFNFFARLFFFLPFTDTQCGFKVFTKRAGKILAGQIKSTGFVWDVEMLYRARKAGLKVVELPIEWHEVSGGPLSKNALATAVKMVWDLVLLRFTVC